MRLFNLIILLKLNVSIAYASYCRHITLYYLLLTPYNYCTLPSSQLILLLLLYLIFSADLMQVGKAKKDVKE